MVLLDFSAPVCSWTGSRFSVAVKVGSVVQEVGGTPLCVLYKKSCSSTVLSIAQGAAWERQDWD